MMNQKGSCLPLPSKGKRKHGQVQGEGPNLQCVLLSPVVVWTDQLSALVVIGEGNFSWAVFLACTWRCIRKITSTLRPQS